MVVGPAAWKIIDSLGPPKNYKYLEVTFFTVSVILVLIRIICHKNTLLCISWVWSFTEALVWIYIIINNLYGIIIIVIV